MSLFQKLTTRNANRQRRNRQPVKNRRLLLDRLEERRLFAADLMMDGAGDVEACYASDFGDCLPIDADPGIILCYGPEALPLPELTPGLSAELGEDGKLVVRGTDRADDISVTEEDGMIHVLFQDETGTWATAYSFDATGSGSVVASIVDKRCHFLWRGRDAGQVERHAADEFLARGRRRRLEPSTFQPPGNEVINTVAAPGTVSDRGRTYGPRRNKCPMLRPDRSLDHPAHSTALA